MKERLLELRKRAVRGKHVGSKERRNIAYNAGGRKTKWLSACGEEKQKVYKGYVKKNQWKLQHRLVVADLDEKVLENIVRKKRIKRRTRKLSENRTRVKAHACLNCGKLSRTVF